MFIYFNAATEKYTTYHPSINQTTILKTVVGSLVYTDTPIGGSRGNGIIFLVPTRNELPGLESYACYAIASKNDAWMS